MHTSATSALAMVFVSVWSSSSSFPISSSLIPPSLSCKPPALHPPGRCKVTIWFQGQIRKRTYIHNGRKIITNWRIREKEPYLMIVYGRPESAKYCSAFLFQIYSNNNQKYPALNLLGWRNNSTLLGNYCGQNVRYRFMLQSYWKLKPFFSLKKWNLYISILYHIRVKRNFRREQFSNQYIPVSQFVQRVIEVSPSHWSNKNNLLHTGSFSCEPNKIIFQWNTYLLGIKTWASVEEI